MGTKDILAAILDAVATTPFKAAAMIFLLLLSSCHEQKLFWVLCSWLQISCLCVCCCCCHLRTSLVGEHKWGALPNLCLKKKKKKKKVEVLVESQAVLFSKV
jgi:hypothetical protein